MTIATLPKELESQSLIRFPDCDPFNHLNNSRYIDYIINAREDQLMSYYDFDVYKLAKEQGLSWVVAQTQIAYLAPAELMEIVTIQTRLMGFTEKGLMPSCGMKTRPISKPSCGPAWPTTTSKPAPDTNTPMN